MVHDPILFCFDRQEENFLFSLRMVHETPSSSSPLLILSIYSSPTIKNEAYKCLEILKDPI